MNRFTLPLILFLGLSVLLWRGLSLDPRELPSALIDQPAPAFSLPILHQMDQQIGPKTMAGKVWLLNVWASWCVACRQEHPVISSIASEIEVVGLNYKDESANAIDWLTRYGNPYIASAFDQLGNVGIDYGVYGVPETFVIDQQGHIRYKHVGPVTTESAKSVLLPIVAQLRNQNPQ